AGQLADGMAAEDDVAAGAECEGGTHEFRVPSRQSAVGGRLRTAISYYGQPTLATPGTTEDCGLMTADVKIGIVTVSDPASAGVYEDKGGPAIRECLTEILSCPWEPVARVIPDERPVIEQTLRDLADRDGCCLIVTTGGTGPAKRDVTPEATEAVCEKMLDGF